MGLVTVVLVPEHHAIKTYKDNRSYTQHQMKVGLSPQNRGGLGSVSGLFRFNEIMRYSPCTLPCARIKTVMLLETIRW
jgi:hypothetical protein